MGVELNVVHFLTMQKAMNKILYCNMVPANEIRMIGHPHHKNFRTELQDVGKHQAVKLIFVLQQIHFSGH